MANIARHPGGGYDERRHDIASFREVSPNRRENHATVATLTMICPLLSGPISILELATKEEWNGEEAQPEEIIGKLREAEIVPERVNNCETAGSRD